jgi:hypothetical protein
MDIGGAVGGVFELATSLHGGFVFLLYGLIIGASVGVILDF